MQPAEPIPLLVIGSSHSWTLNAAWTRRSRSGQQEGLECRFIDVNTEPYHPAIEGKRLNPEIAGPLAKEDLRLLVSMVGGNDHNILGLVNHHPRKFDFVLPESPELPIQPDADVLPYEVVRLTLLKRLRWAFLAMTAIREATPLPAIHLESPPPIPSEEFIREHSDAFDEVIRQYGVSPASLRYKLWRLHSSLVREKCEQLQIRFVPVPKSMQDEQGMLVPEAWWRDPTHANHVYGERLYRQVLAIVERRFASGSQAPTGA